MYDIDTIINDDEVKRLRAAHDEIRNSRDWEGAADAQKELTARVLALLEVECGAPVGILTYNSNNSGGSWWLSDEDWRKLSDAGWVVHYGQSRAYGTPLEQITPTRPGDRWLGALATSAALVCTDPNAAVRAWETLTGQDAGAEGCNCCGEPHAFEFLSPKGETQYSDVIVTSTFGGF